ncbi:hypothetical protein GCM10010525_13330 [Glutamicibacter bergerei]
MRITNTRLLCRLNKGPESDEQKMPATQFYQPRAGFYALSRGMRSFCAKGEHRNEFRERNIRQ